MVTEKLNEIYDPVFEDFVPLEAVNPQFFEEGTCGGLCGCTPAQPTANGTVYLSGPISGETYEDARFGWRKYVADRMSPGIRVLSPMRHEGHLAEIAGTLEKEYPEHFFSQPRVLVEKDYLDIQRSDIMLVNLLDAKRVSIGSMVEIGMAYALGRKVIVVLDKGDMHDHPFVTETSALVLNNLDDAIMAINSLLSEGI